MTTIITDKDNVCCLSQFALLCSFIQYIAILDISSGALDTDVCWSDTFIDDYILMEVQVFWIFNSEHIWDLWFQCYHFPT